jgi:hypothetical protein
LTGKEKRRERKGEERGRKERGGKEMLISRGSTQEINGK